MAHLLRLIVAALLFAFSAVLAPVAHAAFPAPAAHEEWRYCAWQSPSGSSYVCGDYSTSKETACASWRSLYAAADGRGYPKWVPAGLCGMDFQNADGEGQVHNNGAEQNRWVDGVCPANSTLSGSSCTCTAPNVQNATNDGCTAPSDPDEVVCRDAALLASATFGDDGSYQIAGQKESGVVCVPTDGVSAGKGCRADFSLSLQYRRDGKWLSDGQITRIGGMGQKCTMPVNADEPGPGETDQATKTQCPVGQQMGQINGVDVCRPFDSSVPVVTKETKEKTGDVGGVPTTVNESSETKCEKGVCTTTKTTVTTTTSSSGSTSSTTSTATETQSKGSFCASNTASEQCGGSGGGDGVSSFAGACKAGFECKGDAVQCAIAKEQHTRNCEVFDHPEALADFQAKAAITSAQGVGENVAFSSAMFDMSNALGVAARCMPDKSLTIPLPFGVSRTVSLPFSLLCPYLESMGMVLMAVSFLLAARITLRG